MDYPNSLMPGVGLVAGKFTDGNPLASVPASLDPAVHMNAVTDEIKAVIEGFGLVAIEGVNNQMYQALVKIIGDYKPSVRVASTVAINLAAPGANIDGIAMVAGNTFLEKDHGTPALRGIYVWNGAAVPATRALWADDGLELNSGALIPVEEGTTNLDSLWMLTTDGAVTIGVTALAFARKDIVAQKIPRGYKAGLTLSTAGASTSMGIAVGQASDSTNSTMLELLSAFTKTTASWAAGTGNGGLDTGATLGAANTWYYWYEIYNPTTLVVDVNFSLSPIAPTLPAGFTKFRYIGAAKLDGSKQWIRFVQNGDEFTWDNPILDFNGTGSTTAALLTCTLPLGRKVKGNFVISSTSTGNNTTGTYLSDPSNADVAPSGTTAPLLQIGFDGNAATTYHPFGTTQCWTNTSGQVRHREQSFSTLQIETVGWTDLCDQNS